MTDWIAIGHVNDIPRQGARCVRTPEGTVAVFRTYDDKIFAMDDQCPHKGGPLSQGIVHDRAVTCPLHGMVLSLETGEALAPDEGAVRIWPVKNENGLLFIKIPAFIRKASEETLQISLPSHSA